MRVTLPFLGCVLAALNVQISGHGMLMDPVNRSSAWRKGFDTPRNYDDNENFCGGFGTQFWENDGKCGVCGDNYADPQPRDNENTGKYGRGVIVKTYASGERITTIANLTANHRGHFYYSVCPLSDPEEIETDECFDRYPLKLSTGEDSYVVPVGVIGEHKVDLLLPRGLTCRQCVLRWHYVVGNNWGVCPDGTSAVGCGPQETFRSCSDITIVD